MKGRFGDGSWGRLEDFEEYLEGKLEKLCQDADTSFG
jgi:hypothetical protein